MQKARFLPHLGTELAHSAHHAYGFSSYPAVDLLMLRFVFSMKAAMLVSTVINGTAALAIVILGAPPVTMVILIGIVLAIGTVGQGMEAREREHHPRR